MTEPAAARTSSAPSSNSSRTLWITTCPWPHRSARHAFHHQHLPDSIAPEEGGFPLGDARLLTQRKHALTFSPSRQPDGPWLRRFSEPVTVGKGRQTRESTEMPRILTPVLASPRHSRHGPYHRPRGASDETSGLFRAPSPDDGAIEFRVDDDRVPDPP